MVSRDVENFEKMLLCDMFRGMHSTGVYAGFVVDGENHLQIEKAALPGDMYLRSEYWDAVKTMKVPSKVNPNTNLVYQPKFLVGHNRYATQGAVNDRNAHPFQHGNITLVHNGTLVNQPLLPDSARFAVDSENVCWSIHKIGIEETIKKLDGAFTLVWHDSDLKTLNIIRNDERPFHLVETASGDWYGASEEDMVMWILTRKKYGITIKRHFECEVGVQYIFDVSKGFVFKEEVKHTLPTFPKYSYSNWGAYGQGSAWQERQETRSASRTWNNQPSVGNGSGYGSGNGSVLTPLQAKREEMCELIAGHSLNCRIGDTITFQAFGYEAYPSSPDLGKLSGFTGEMEWVEVAAHATPKNIFVDGMYYNARVVSAFEQNYLLTLMVADVRPAQPVVREADTFLDTPITQEELNEILGEMDDEEDEKPEYKTTCSGDRISYDEWEKSPEYNRCGVCDQHITFHELDSVVLYNGACICTDCQATLAEQERDEQLRAEEENAKAMTEHNNFICRNCFLECPPDLESKDDEICINCYDHLHKVKKSKRPVLSIVKRLKNGVSVSHSSWASNYGNCVVCKRLLDWGEADNYAMMDSRCLCHTCANEYAMHVEYQ
ncbi:glutamine amidotransferase [Aeromonas phage BUCT695]|uniref:glutamine amidotransferase n=1 Tax=Aeromonas phage BUCT695 TaxID=2908630 RepID=UPI00232977B5|nr:glutamine amidotransferase [Aeromonas phage BUCT695]UIW10518.1 glutamine transaminase [Aeromonas phage BUCT695]